MGRGSNPRGSTTRRPSIGRYGGRDEAQDATLSRCLCLCQAGVRIPVGAPRAIRAPFGSGPDEAQDATLSRCLCFRLAGVRIPLGAPRAVRAPSGCRERRRARHPFKASPLLAGRGSNPRGGTTRHPSAFRQQARRGAGHHLLKMTLLLAAGARLLVRALRARPQPSLGYFICHWGWRFSAKAFAPSTASSDPQTDCTRLALMRRP